MVIYHSGACYSSSYLIFYSQSDRGPRADCDHLYRRVLTVIICIMLIYRSACCVRAKGSDLSSTHLS